MLVISRQQRRLLFLFLIAFTLLTVPAILVLIKSVPPDEVNAMDDAVEHNNATAVKPVNKVLSTESNVLAANNNSGSTKYNNSQTTIKPNATNSVPMQRAYIAGNWVVVDCGRRIVLQCPHKLVNKGTSPRFGRANEVFKLHCRDVSIKLDSFCGL